MAPEVLKVVHVGCEKKTVRLPKGGIMVSRYWPLALIILAPLLLYYPNLNYYFFQDDWFVLNQVNISSFDQFLSLFKFRTDIIYYRPVGMFSFFFIAKSFFGLNPLAYHVVAFILHLTNSLLIGYIAFKIFKNPAAAYISSFMYATAAFHFMTLSWLSLTWNILGTTFFLLAFVTYLNFSKLKKPQSIVLSLIFFILSLLSSEFALSFAAFIILFELFYKSNLNRKFGFENLAMILLVVIFSVVYLLSRIVSTPVPTVGEYDLVFDQGVIINAFWYLIWLVNIPEVIKYNIKLLPLSFSNDPTFLNPFRSYLFPIIISLSMFVASMFYIFIKNLNIETLRKFMIAFFFLILGLLPVIFLSNHSFPYYLGIPSIFFFFLVAHLSSSIYENRINNLKKIFLIILLLGWFLTSLLTISFTRKTHWIPAEQAISKEITEATLRSNSTPESPQEVTISNSTDQIKQSLMDQNAMQVIYNNDNLKTIYK